MKEENFSQEVFNEYFKSAFENAEKKEEIEMIYPYLEKINENYDKQTRTLNEIFNLINNSNYLRSVILNFENESLKKQYEKLMIEKEINYVEYKIKKYNKCIETEKKLLQKLYEGKTALDNDDIEKYNEIWNQQKIKEELNNEIKEILNKEA